LRFRSHGHHLLLLLAFLAEDVLASVLHALALVGFGAAELADFGGNLADALLVDAADTTISVGFGVLISMPSGIG
jgi:hypothetical protein